MLTNLRERGRGLLVGGHNLVLFNQVVFVNDVGDLLDFFELFLIEVI